MDFRFGVFDGATSLTEQIYECGHTGGFLVSRIAGETFTQNNDSLVNLTQKANTAIADAMAVRGIDLDDKVQSWCWRCVHFRWLRKGFQQPFRNYLKILDQAQ